MSKKDDMPYIHDGLISDMAIAVGTHAFNFMGLLELLHTVNKKYEKDLNRVSSGFGTAYSKSRSRDTSRSATSMKMCCSPLSHKYVKPSVLRVIYDGPTMEFIKQFKETLHLRWTEHTNKLFSSDMFLNNIEDCLDACANNKCKFVVISLYIKGIGGAHANYIIIHDNMAYRIEPHGFNRTILEEDSQGKFEDALIKLFDEYDVTYVPHSKLNVSEGKGHKYYGLQHVGEINNYESTDPKLKLIVEDAPGLCNTYVFLYITKFCQLSMRHSNRDLAGLDLFISCIEEIDHGWMVTQSMARTNKEALLSNQQILLFETQLYQQLLEIPLATQIITRAKSKKYTKQVRDQEEKLKKAHFDTSRDQLDMDMYDIICEIFRKWSYNYDILGIYGVNFKQLISELGGKKKKKKKGKGKKLLTKGKKKKKQKKKKKTKQKKKH